MVNITISNEDIIHLIMQFMIENNLKEAFKKLKDESGVKYAYVIGDVSSIKDNIMSGNWDKVFQSLECVSLKKETLFMLYEAIIIELVEATEFDIAKCVLFKMSSEVTNQFKFEFKAKFDLLNSLIEKEITSDMYYSSINSTLNLINNRKRLASLVSEELTSILPGRLICLLGQALIQLKNEDNIQKATNIFNTEYSFKSIDINTSSSFVKTKADFHIDLSEDKSFVTCADFSLDGNYLATGSNDGLIELWDVDTFKQSQTLQYQVDGNLMFHNESISVLSFSQNSKLICSGDVASTIKLFSVESGKCLGTFNNVHSKAITSVKLSHNNDLLISSSLDGTIIVIGLKSMKLISEINAHSSFINNASIYWENDTYYSASSDGSAKIWNIRDNQLIRTITINEDTNKSLIGIKVNKNGNAIFVSNKTNTVYLIDYCGHILKLFCTGKKGSIQFFEVSNDNMWLYCIDEDNYLYVFNVQHAVIVNIIELGKGKEILGIVMSNVSEILGIYSNDGLFCVYK